MVDVDVVVVVVVVDAAALTTGVGVNGGVVVANMADSLAWSARQVTPGMDGGVVVNVGDVVRLRTRASRYCANTSASTFKSKSRRKHKRNSRSFSSFFVNPPAMA